MRSRSIYFLKLGKSIPTDAMGVKGLSMVDGQRDVHLVLERHELARASPWQRDTPKVSTRPQRALSLHQIIV